MARYLRHIFLPLLISLLIFAATCLWGAQNIPKLPKSLPWDKLVHFGMFFVLSAISYIDYYRLHNGKPRKGRWIFWGFVVPVIYGGAIELMQKYFFTSRGAEWADWVADILGSLAATIIAIIYLQRKENSKKNISL